MIRPIVGQNWWMSSIYRGLGMFTAQAAMIMLFTIGIAKFDSPHAFTQPAPELMPGSSYGNLTGCDSLHDGYFRCLAAGYGGDVALLVDGSTGYIISTSVQVHEEPLGNLILLLGTPSGYTIRDDLVEVAWGRQGVSAYLPECELAVDTPVFQVMYSATETVAFVWHGLIGELENCSAD